MFILINYSNTHLLHKQLYDKITIEPKWQPRFQELSVLWCFRCLIVLTLSIFYWWCIASRWKSNLIVVGKQSSGKHGSLVYWTHLCQKTPTQCWQAGKPSHDIRCTMVLFHSIMNLLWCYFKKTMSHKTISTELFFHRSLIIQRINVVTSKFHMLSHEAMLTDSR